MIANQYESARSTQNTIDEEAELEKLSRLARVVQTTAVAAVLLSRGAAHVEYMVGTAREVARQHSEHIGADATGVMTGLLDDMEQRASSTGEPEA